MKAAITGEKPRDIITVTSTKSTNRETSITRESETKDIILGIINTEKNKMINHDRSTRRLVLNTANALSWLSEIKERDTERMMNANYVIYSGS